MTATRVLCGVAICCSGVPIYLSWFVAVYLGLGLIACLWFAVGLFGLVSLLVPGLCVVLVVVFWLFVLVCGFCCLAAFNFWVYFVVFIMCLVCSMRCLLVVCYLRVGVLLFAGGCCWFDLVFLFVAVLV